MRRLFVAAAIVSVFISGCGEGRMAASGPAERGLERLDFRSVVRQAKDKVFPAVVFIKCLREAMESGKKTTEEIVGSGVILSPTGEVLTNWHVADKAVDIRCLLYDGRSAPAKVVGGDKDTDLALLQLELPPATPPLPCGVLGDSESLKEGDFVMAMGAPWGMERSVSMGIISCTRRYLPQNSEYSLWLQTDAAISPGNSGGPLVNTQGEVIGINTRAIISGGDTGFAVPSRTVREVVSQIRAHGRMNWAWTGLQLQPLRDFQRNIYFDGNEGVIVGATDPESPARGAGIMARDRIIRVAGKPVTALTEENLPGIRMELGLLPKQKPVEIEFVRGTEKRTATLTPREKGKVEGEELDFPRWDFTAKAINQFDNPLLYFHRKKGVFVFGVKRPGNAVEASPPLSTQDIILRIDGKDIETLDDLMAAHKAALGNIATKHRTTLTILRDGLLRQVVLDFSRDYERGE
jgi:serine protease Do